MQGTYYENDRVSSLIFVLVMCAAFLLALYIDKKIAEKKGRTEQCMACENRRGAYPPNNCPNHTCKFYHK